MDNVTIISIAVAILVMSGIAYFVFTQIGRSGGSAITGKKGDGKKGDGKN